MHERASLTFSVTGYSVDCVRRLKCWLSAPTAVSSVRPEAKEKPVRNKEPKVAQIRVHNTLPTRL